MGQNASMNGSSVSGTNLSTPSGSLSLLGPGVDSNRFPPTTVGLINSNNTNPIVTNGAHFTQQKSNDVSQIIQQQGKAWPETHFLQDVLNHQPLTVENTNPSTQQQSQQPQQPQQPTNTEDPASNITLGAKTSVEGITGVKRKERENDVDTDEELNPDGESTTTTTALTEFERLALMMHEDDNDSNKPSEDGFRWRKYGRKSVKGSKYPRSYYKCTYPGCQVKKQVEVIMKDSAPTITTTYKGSHAHERPQVTNVRATDQQMFRNVVLDGFAQQITAIADNRQPSMPRLVVETSKSVNYLDDGYRWRKYGQKLVKGNKWPRSYYKCSEVECMVKKQVDQLDDAIVNIYEGTHNHHPPSADGNRRKRRKSVTAAPLASDSSTITTTGNETGKGRRRASTHIIDQTSTIDPSLLGSHSTRRQSITTPYTATHSHRLYDQQSSQLQSLPVQHQQQIQHQSIATGQSNTHHMQHHHIDMSNIDPASLPLPTSNPSSLNNADSSIPPLINAESHIQMQNNNNNMNHNLNSSPSWQDNSSQTLTLAPAMMGNPLNLSGGVYDATLSMDLEAQYITEEVGME